MNPTQRFLEYAAAFEKTYDDDDWSRLEPFFTEDAVYEANGEPPLGGRYEGRDALLAGLKHALDSLDRRYDKRIVALLGEPKSGPDSFEMGWRATYEKAGAPDLVFDGYEVATFEGDRIARLVDTVEEGTDRRIREHLDRHFD